MCRAVVLILVAPAMAAAQTSPPPSPAKPAPAANGKLVVLPVLGKLPKPRQRMLEDALVDAAEAALVVQVIGPAEARELLTPKQRRAFAKCKKDACFARLAEPLGAAWMLFAQVRPAKGQLKLSLALIDRDANVLERRALTVAASEPELGSALKGEIEALRAALPQEAAAAAETVAPTAPPASPIPAPAAATPPAATVAAPVAPVQEATPAASESAADTARDAMPAASSAPGWLGVQHSSVDQAIATDVGLDPPRGTQIDGVARNGPGAAAGLRAGDVIVAYAGKAVPSARHLADLLKDAHAGDTIVLTLWRDGGETQVTVTLAERAQ